MLVCRTWAALKTSVKPLSSDWCTALMKWTRSRPWIRWHWKQCVQIIMCVVTVYYCINTWVDGGINKYSISLCHNPAQITRTHIYRLSFFINSNISFWSRTCLFTCLYFVKKSHLKEKIMLRPLLWQLMHPQRCAHHTLGIPVLKHYWTAREYELCLWIHEGSLQYQPK